MRLHSPKQPAVTSRICSLERLTKPLGASPSLLASPSKVLGTGKIQNWRSKHRQQRYKRTRKRKDTAFYLGFGSGWTLKRTVG